LSKNQAGSDRQQLPRKLLYRIAVAECSRIRFIVVPQPNEDDLFRINLFLDPNGRAGFALTL